ncbi:SCO3374 family protein [Streptomyces parvulus]|uniref:SCO3374 family protein n=1 Tax=Streptomyces parvulus TaxID=146923 RepID=UPI0036A46835
MAGALPPVPAGHAFPVAPLLHGSPTGPVVVPPPRRPLGAGPRREPREKREEREEGARSWYERVLGWPTAPGVPPRLRVGVRFDVLDVPAEAGRAALGRLGPTGPVAVRGGRMLLLVAAGGAEEVPGLLEWLEWGSLPLDLSAVGAGGLMEAPLVPAGAPAPGREGRQGAAFWLRPPKPGYEAEASLPALSVPGGSGSAPDLARLVHTLATQCHRVRLAAGTAGAGGRRRR